MFVRVKPVVQNGQRYEYLQIVRSERAGAPVRQQLVANLGRRDLLVATGKLDQFLQALARFTPASRWSRPPGTNASSLATPRPGAGAGVRPAVAAARPARDPRPPGRRPPLRLAPERVAFALALQRLCAPGSDLQGAAWTRTVEAPGFDDLALHYFYRTKSWPRDLKPATPPFAVPGEPPDLLVHATVRPPGWRDGTPDRMARMAAGEPASWRAGASVGRHVGEMTGQGILGDGAPTRRPGDPPLRGRCR